MPELSISVILFGLGYGISWVIAALAYALPKPTESDTKKYVIWYRLVQFMGANLERMAEKKLPVATQVPK